MKLTTTYDADGGDDVAAAADCDSDSDDGSGDYENEDVVAESLMTQPTPSYLN